MNKLFTKQLAFLIFSAFLSFSSLRMINPVIALYSESINAKKYQLGFIMGVFAIAALGSRIPFGKYVDAHGKKLTVCFGTLLFSICPILYSLCPSPLYLVIARLIHGVGFAAMSIAMLAMILDVAPKERFGEVLGYYGIATNSASILATALSGYVMDVMGFKAAFYVSALFGILAFLSVFRMREAPRMRRESPMRIRDVIRNHDVVLASVGVLFITIPVGVMTTFLPIYFDELKLSKTSIGLFFSIQSMAALLSRPYLGRLSDRVGRMYLIVPSMLIVATCFFFISICQRFYQFALVAVVYGITFGCAIGCLFALTVDSIATDSKGTAMSVSTTLAEAGVAGGAMFISLLASFLPTAMLFTVSSGMIFLGLLVLIGTSRFLSRSEIGVRNSEFAVSESRTPNS